MSERVEGEVVWFENARGYGFIQPASGGKQIFVHHSAIEMNGYKTLKQGQRVSFVVVKGQKGPQSEEVRVIE